MTYCVGKSVVTAAAAMFALSARRGNHRRGRFVSRPIYAKWADARQQATGLRESEPGIGGQRPVNHSTAPGYMVSASSQPST